MLRWRGVCIVDRREVPRGKMNVSLSNCSSVTQLFLFLVHSVSQPSWEQLLLVAPESTVNQCKACFTEFPVLISVTKCPHASSSNLALYLADVTGPTTLIFLCGDPLSMYLLSTLSLEHLRNLKIFVLSPAGPVFPSLQAWPQAQKHFTTSHIFLFKYTEEYGFHDLHSVFRLKNETLASQIPGSLRFGEDQLGDLGGVDIAIAVVNADFYKFDADVFIRTDGKAELRPCFVSELFHILPAALNFTAVLWVSDHWGKYDAKTSSWRGMIGDLVNGDTDLALSSVVHNDQRREVVDFNIDLYNWKFLALFRQPDFRRDSMAFLRPFDRYVWVAMMLSIIFLALATFGIKIIHEFLRDEELEDEQFEWNFGVVRRLFDAVFNTLALLCGVGLRDDDDEMALPVKVLFLSKSLLGVILYAFYGGMLISFLAVADVPFSSLEQLLATPYRFDAMSGDPFLMLQGAASSSVQKVVQRISQPLPYIDVGSAREELVMGSYVFLAYDMNAYYDMSRKYRGDESCSIGEVDLPVDGPKLGTAMLKGSPLLRIFDYVILKCKVYGLDDRWIRTYLPSRPDCMVQKSDEGIPMNSVMVPICILAFGMTISFVMLLAETITHWHITSNERIRNSLTNPLDDNTTSTTVYDPWHDTISLKSIAT